VSNAATPALRVLVADDNRDAADTLCALLRLHGHLCRACYDGDAALQAAREFLPHVVLLDLVMPHDGFQAAQALRREHGTVVLVAVTGHPSVDKLARSSEVGFDFLLTKPADAEEVLRILGAVRAGLGT
jgi:DNA-binding response OmpR family regulator